MRLSRHLWVAGFLLAAAVGEGAAASPSQLRLTLSTANINHVVYEPVVIEYEVSNPTSDEIVASIAMDAAQQQIQFSIKGPGGDAVSYSSQLARCGAVASVAHEPGSVLRSETELRWNHRTKAFAFAEPGTYEVKARMLVAADPEAVYIEAKAAEVSIRAPATPDSEAINFFASKADFFTLMRDGTVSYCEGRPAPSCFEELSGFIRRYRDSAYAPWIAWDLAEAVGYGLMKVTPRYETAVELLRFHLATWPGHPNTRRVMYQLAMMLGEAGRMGEAQQVRRQFETLFPEREDMIDQLRRQIH